MSSITFTLVGTNGGNVFSTNGGFGTQVITTITNSQLSGYTGTFTYTLGNNGTNGGNNPTGQYVISGGGGGLTSIYYNNLPLIIAGGGGGAGAIGVYYNNLPYTVYASGGPGGSGFSGITGTNANGVWALGSSGAKGLGNSFTGPNGGDGGMGGGNLIGGNGGSGGSSAYSGTKGSTGSVNNGGTGGVGGVNFSSPDTIWPGEGGNGGSGYGGAGGGGGGGGQNIVYFDHFNTAGGGGGGGAGGSFSAITSTTTFSTPSTSSGPSLTISWTTYPVLQYNATTQTVFYDTVKTFVIEHPLSIDKYLVHACLEGPEAGVYYRGTATIRSDFKCVDIYLADYVSRLADDFTIYVTPLWSKGDSDGDIPSAFPTLVARPVVNGKFKVYSDIIPCTFNYSVFAKRQTIKVEPMKQLTSVNGDGPYKSISFL